MKCVDEPNQKRLQPNATSEDMYSTHPNEGIHHIMPAKDGQCPCS